MITCKQLLSTALLYFVTHSAIAQSRRFNDSWVLFDRVPISGQQYSNGVSKMVTIKVGSDSLYLDDLVMDTQGEDVISSEIMPLNNKLMQLTLSNKAIKKLLVDVQGADATFFTVHTNVYASKDTTKSVYRQTDHYELQGDQLILVRKAENLTNGEVWECKAIYERRDI